MEKLNEAWETEDKKVFKYKEEAEEHEENIKLEKAINKLLRRWWGYGMEEDFRAIAKRAVEDKEELREVLGVNYDSTNR